MWDQRNDILMQIKFAVENRVSPRSEHDDGSFANYVFMIVGVG